MFASSSASLLPRMSARLAASRFFSSQNKPVNILVIDGYAKEGREDLLAGGASTAGDLYVNMIKKSSPVPVNTTLFYPADVGFDHAPDLAQFSGVAWTGCSLTVYHDHDPRVTNQLTFAKAVNDLRIPSFGSCWAAQISVTAAGGKVAQHPWGREMGISRKIRLTAAGRAHPMFEGKPDVFDAFTSHDDEITHVPAGGLILASNSWSYVQATSVIKEQAPFWAVQYHPEYDLHEMARLVNCRIQKLKGYGYFKEDADALSYIDDLEALHEDPTRKDIAWKLGIDADVMNEDVRHVEVRNWMRKLVLPFHQQINGFLTQ